MGSYVSGGQVYRLSLLRSQAGHFYYFYPYDLDPGLPLFALFCKKCCVEVFDAARHAQPTHGLSLYRSHKEFGYAPGIDAAPEGMRL